MLSIFPAYIAENYSETGIVVVFNDTEGNPVFILPFGAEYQIQPEREGITLRAFRVNGRRVYITDRRLNNNITRCLDVLE